MSIIFFVLLLGAAAAGATEQFERRLPLYERYQCLNCHLSADPASADLNSFGRDFQARGNTWDAYLAGLDSDGDGCDNGAELGDVDGNGIPDQGVGRESSNPGVAGDCSADIDPVSWGQLKAMFDGRR